MIFDNFGVKFGKSTPQLATTSKEGTFKGSTFLCYFKSHYVPLCVFMCAIACFLSDFSLVIHFICFMFHIFNLIIIWEALKYQLVIVRGFKRCI